MSNNFKRKSLSFEEYWLLSEAWKKRGLPLRSARALVNNGILTLNDVHRAYDLELATIPGVGPKSVVLLYELIGRQLPRPRPGGRPKLTAGSTKHVAEHQEIRVFRESSG